MYKTIYLSFINMYMLYFFLCQSVPAVLFFSGLLQEELHRVGRHWNTNRIRPYPNQESHPGKPDILYFIPELTGKSGTSLFHHRS